ncbi:MAG TPA: hypothetical protein VN257_11100, partial [Actinotalea sp.]|nr:hypothetical protein [Actinotalea sp.]
PATWVPVPVPRPSYVLKPAARRADPAPLVLDQPGAAPATAAPATAAPEAEDVPVADDRPTTGGLALDAILARRRASGE